MKIVVGLGNPEKKYQKSRHNLGFMVLDELGLIFEVGSWRLEKKFHSYIFETTIRSLKKAKIYSSSKVEKINFGFNHVLDSQALKCVECSVARTIKNSKEPRDEKILLVKPQTHMNLSGQAVKALVDYYKLSLEDVWVINDDIDLSLGTIRINKGASSAGHRGVQSIIDELGSQDFIRFRIGIRNFPLDKKPDTNDFVMANFRPEEKEILKQTIKKAIESISMALREGFKF